MADAENNSTPPWGDDFDAEKAWKLIQNLRTDKTELTEKVTSLTTDLETERQAREAAEKAVSEADVDGKVAAAEQRAAEAEKSLYVERAIRKHEIPEDLVDFLTGDTEEEILKKAERLASVGKPPAGNSNNPNPDDKDGEQDKPKVDAQGRPVPDLRPGHGGDDGPEPFDPDKIVASVRNSTY